MDGNSGGHRWRKRQKGGSPDLVALGCVSSKHRWIHVDVTCRAQVHGTTKKARLGNPPLT